MDTRFDSPVTWNLNAESFSSDKFNILSAFDVRHVSILFQGRWIFYEIT